MRVVNVLFSYFIAAFAGSFMLVLTDVVLSDGKASDIIIWTFIIAFASIASSWFVALPVLIITEVKQIEDLRFYVGTCAIAAPSILWVLTRLTVWNNLESLLLFGCYGAFSGAVYWWLRWKRIEQVMGQTNTK